MTQSSVVSCNRVSLIPKKTEEKAVKATETIIKWKLPHISVIWTICLCYFCAGNECKSKTLKQVLVMMCKVFDVGVFLGFMHQTGMAIINLYCILNAVTMQRQNRISILFWTECTELQNGEVIAYLGIKEGQLWQVLTLEAKVARLMHGMKENKHLTWQQTGLTNRILNPAPFSWMHGLTANLTVMWIIKNSHSLWLSFLVFFLSFVQHEANLY